MASQATLLLAVNGTFLLFSPASSLTSSSPSRRVRVPGATPINAQLRDATVTSAYNSEAGTEKRLNNRDSYALEQSANITTR
jgi:hypothetical protein